MVTGKKEFDYLLNLIAKWLSDCKVGAVTINFFKGGISSIKVEETLKLPKKD